VPCYEHGTTFNPYTDTECHSAQRHRQTDSQTDRRHYDASRSYCVQQYDRLKRQIRRNNYQRLNSNCNAINVPMCLGRVRRSTVTTGGRPAYCNVNCRYWQAYYVLLCRCLWRNHYFVIVGHHSAQTNKHHVVVSAWQCVDATLSLCSVVVATAGLEENLGFFRKPF